MAFSIGIWYDAHNTKGGTVRVKRRRGWLIPVFLGAEGGLYTLFLILDLFPTAFAAGLAAALYPRLEPGATIVAHGRCPYLLTMVAGRMAGSAG